MDIQIGNPIYIYLTGIIIACLLVLFLSSSARARAAARFSTENLRSAIFPSNHRRRSRISAILTTFALVCIVISLLDIRWGKTWREVPQKGLEVMFVLDVSRSMLAEDVAPNRLQRAKQQIKDMVDEMDGDRVGLVVFAGEHKQSIPLTSHYEEFKQSLDSVGTHSLRIGGSRLGNALRGAAAGFISKTNDHKTIVVFTDGEDQESKPTDVAKELFDKEKIRVFTVGLGDMDQGARIPDAENRGAKFVTYEGEAVWSKLNGAILKQIAEETQGVYIPAGTKNVNMSDVYHRFIANVEETEFETAKINAYVARFQWFALPAFLLLVAEVLISTATTKRSKNKPISQLPSSRGSDSTSNPTTTQAA